MSREKLRGAAPAVRARRAAPYLPGRRCPRPAAPSCPRPASLVSLRLPDPARPESPKARILPFHIPHPTLTLLFWEDTHTKNLFSNFRLVTVGLNYPLPWRGVGWGVVCGGGGGIVKQWELLAPLPAPASG